jgi:hypothetical protein
MDNKNWLAALSKCLCQLFSPRRIYEARLVEIAFDDVVAHAMQIVPFAAAVDDEATVEHGHTQAGPLGLSGVKSGQRVGGNDRDPELDTVGIDQRHPLAAPHLLGRVIAPRPAHWDAFYRLGVDEGPARVRRTAWPRPP